MADADRVADLERTIAAQQRTIEALMDAVEQRDLASTPSAFAVWHQHAALADVVERKTRRLRAALDEIRGLHESLTAKTAELEAKRDEAAMLALVARHMESAVLICDAGGCVEWANESFTVQTGHTFAEAVGRRAVDLLLSPEAADEVNARIQARTDRAEAFSVEALSTAKDGRCYPVELDVRPVVSDEGAVWRVVAILRDISARKEAEARLAQAERLESIGELAAGVAHEINTPMQYIGDNLTFLRRAVEVGHPLFALLSDPAVDWAKAAEIVTERHFRFVFDRAPGAIDQALEGVAAVSKIVAAMRAFSRVGSGDAKTLTDVNACVETALTFSRSEWRYVAEVETRLAPDLPLIEADGGAINQVILNLIVNAAQAIRGGARGDASGTITVTTSHDRDAGHVVLEVGDDGPGIPPGIIGRVFDPFFTTKQVGEGLALAQSIVVKRHGGSIDVSSIPEHATLFTVRLPIESGDSGETTA